MYLFTEGHSRGQKIEKNEQSLYDEFKAKEAFDSLDRAMDEMKGSLSIAKTT